jgi:NADH-quinone oxidoreductase subunit G
MQKQVTLTIDGREVTVPEGTLIVDAAKQLGIDIPVFCYHPKMEPVGMCRMCLVEIGRPAIDRATGQVLRDSDGSPKIQFGPKLETACTTPVTPGMVVIQNSEKVKISRKDVVEFILTSHPLDCPICDKGGECPLQNLTMGYGPGQSRFEFDEKMHLEKHLPLGELIYLDRERCIQCGRCVRFQDVIAADSVIGFTQRGRSLEIFTDSEPGFNSYFSGNTTDICPVGALTTADFRFGARPWELDASASICSHCPVGCNLTFNTRREARRNGQVVIKRVMPRQNEAVNEIWICDKGRFGYHYVESDQRLTQPLVRQDGKLVPATWETALKQVAAQTRLAGSSVITLAGGRLSNEALFNLKQFTDHLQGQALLYGWMGGGEFTTQVGLGPGSNLSDLGKGDTLVVAASDLEEEAPLWSLRIRQAVKRGASLIVINPRLTKLEKSAAQTIRYPYGEETQVVTRILDAVNSINQNPKPDSTPEPESPETVSAETQISALLKKAENLVIFFGSEGLGLKETQSLGQACASLLVATGHTAKPNNGLVGVWDKSNTQGAFELGYRPENDLADRLAQSKLVLVAAADPAGDDPALEKVLDPQNPSLGKPFVVVQELFLTRTCELADVVLPAQAFTEFEGTFTSGERRVQRFYPILSPLAGTHSDFSITAELAAQLGIELEGSSSRAIFERIAGQAPVFAGLSYEKLAEVTPQQPMLSRHDLYYGGTNYENHEGLGKQLLHGSPVEADLLPEKRSILKDEDKGRSLLAVPYTRLYDGGQTLLPSKLLEKRMAGRRLAIHPQDAVRLNLLQDVKVWVRFGEVEIEVGIDLDTTVPTGIALAARSVGLPVHEPVKIEIL